MQERLVPLFAPRHRAPCVFAPRALDAELVAGEEHRHAGQRHLQPDAHEVAVGGAGDRPEAGRVVAVEQIPRVQHRLPRHAGAKAAQGGDCRGAVQARHPHRDAPELPLLLGMRIVAQQPRPERAQEAGVVHHPVPAADGEVGTEVVPVLGDQQRVAHLLARPLRHVVIQVEIAVATDHVRDVDAPAVETELEVMAQDDREAIMQFTALPVELRQRAMAEPGLVAAGDRVV